MTTIHVFLLPLLLFTVVSSKRSKGHLKHDHTIKDDLRVYVTERVPAWNAHNVYVTERPPAWNVHNVYVTERPPAWNVHNVYVTKRPSEWKVHNDFDDNPIALEERGKVTKLLDLKGDIKERFALIATSNDASVSVICSPFSATMPLGILMYGAGNDETEKELLYAVGLEKKSKAHDYFRDLRHKIKHLSGPTTHLATRIFVNKDKTLKRGFKEDAEDTFGTSVESINMDNAERATKTINYWVRKHTKEMIDNIISPRDILPDSSVIIVDAIYFEALWKKKFVGSNYSPFYGAKGKKELKMMHRKGDYMYGASKALAAQVIIIPYKGDASMIVLLPKEKNGLDLLLRQLRLAPDLINNIKMQTTYVDLKLPKFRIETSLDLKLLYEKVGLTEMFSAANGLEGLVKGETVVIAKAIQKTMIEVDELGTVASSASMVGGVGAARPPPDMVYFTANHPFLFFVVAHKQQLFAGTFVG